MSKLDVDIEIMKKKQKIAQKYKEISELQIDIRHLELLKLEKASEIPIPSLYTEN